MLAALAYFSALASAALLPESNLADPPALQYGSRSVTKMVSNWVHWQVKVGSTCWELVQVGEKGWRINKRCPCRGNEEWTGMWTSASDATIDGWADDFIRNNHQYPYELFSRLAGGVNCQDLYRDLTWRMQWGASLANPAPKTAQASALPAPALKESTLIPGVPAPQLQWGTRTVTKMVSDLVHWQLKVGNTCWELGRSGEEGWRIAKHCPCRGYEEWTGMWTSASDATIDGWADDFARNNAGVPYKLFSRIAGGLNCQDFYRDMTWRMLWGASLAEAPGQAPKALA